MATMEKDAIHPHPSDGVFSQVLIKYQVRHSGWDEIFSSDISSINLAMPEIKKRIYL
jgi:hypothetical protein